jgi:hypothetical protein
MSSFIVYDMSYAGPNSGTAMMAKKSGLGVFYPKNSFFNHKTPYKTPIEHQETSMST